MPGGRKPSWDTELGRLLWLDGKTDAQIAEEMGTTEAAVANVRLRRWQKGTERPQPEEVLPNEQAPAEASAEKSGGGSRRSSRGRTISGAAFVEHGDTGWCLRYPGRGYQNQEWYRGHLHGRCNPLPLELGQRRRSEAGQGGHQLSAA